MRFYTSIDYLTFTSPEPPRWKIPQQTVPSPVPFYRVAIKYSNGTLANFGNPNSDLWLVVMSSQAIENCGFLPEDNARNFINQRVQQGCKFSRVDLAVTVEQEGEFTVGTFGEWLKSGKITGPDFRLENAKGIVDKFTDQDETIYLGNQKKRAKKGIIRAYDKSLEMGEDPGKITRVEIEEKREVANNIARQFAGGERIGAIMAKRLQIETELWRTLTGNEVAQDVRFREEKLRPPIDKTWMWLVEKIAPVLGRKIAEDEEFGTSAYVRAFFDEVSKSTHVHKLTLNQLDDTLTST